MEIKRPEPLKIICISVKEAHCYVLTALILNLTILNTRKRENKKSKISLTKERIRDFYKTTNEEEGVLTKRKQEQSSYGLQYPLFMK